MKKLFSFVLIACMFATFIIVPASAEIVSDDITSDVLFLYDMDMEELGIDLIKDNASFVGSSSFTTNTTAVDPGGYNLVDNRSLAYTLTDGTIINKSFSMLWMNNPSTDSGVAVNDAKLGYTFNVETAGTYEFIFVMTAVRTTEEAAQRGFGYSIDSSSKKLVNIDNAISMAYSYTYSYSDMVFNGKGDSYFQPGYVYGITADLTVGAHTLDFYHYEDWGANGRPNYGGFYYQPVTDAAQNGTCGDNLNWSIIDKTLIIGGQGNMATYPDAYSTPWGFASSEIEQVLIQKDVTGISEYTFKGYTNLKKVVLGNSLSTFPASGFDGCNALETLVAAGNITGITSDSFKDKSLKTLIMKNAGTDAFTPDMVKQCSTLENLTVVGTISELSSEMFSTATELKTINLAVSDLTAGIPANLFKDCTKLETISITGDVGTIGDSAFEGCSALANFNVTGNITSIGNNTFKGCSSFETFKFFLYSNITSIGESAFEGCTALTSFKPGKTITTIGANVINGCTAVTDIELKDAVTSIGDNAFTGCTALENFKYGGTVEQWKALVGTQTVIDNTVTVACSDGDVTPTGVMLDTTAVDDTTAPSTPSSTTAPNANDTTATTNESGCSCGSSSIFIAISTMISGMAVLVFTKKKI